MVKAYEQNPFVLPDDQPWYEDEPVESGSLADRLMIDTPVSSNSEQVVSTPEQPAEIVLSVEGISKKFCRSLRRSLFYGMQDIVGELTGSRQESTTLRTNEFWALKDVHLQLRRGEAIGLVGANGSGKTTLLRIISGLIKPDMGRVRVRGRVAPLIALGAGFSPVLTGRENIYANMSILGLSKPQIEERFAAVVDFAELWEAIDTPVQTYSSGMAARLGFACAVHTEPDVLLVDEVLAVGDIKFRSKCERKLHDLLEQGTSFVLVSHFSQSMLNICNSAVYLSHGKVMMAGDTRQVLEQYQEDLFAAKETTADMPLHHLSRSPTGTHTGAAIAQIYFESPRGEVIEAPVTGEATQLCICFETTVTIDNTCLFIAVYKFSEGETVALHLNSFLDGQLNHTTFQVAPGRYTVKAKLPYLGLAPGLYTMKAFLKDGAVYTLDAIDAFRFRVEKQESLNRGIYYQHRDWELVDESC